MFFQVARPSSRILPLELQRQPCKVVYEGRLLHRIRVPAMFLRGFPRGTMRVYRLRVGTPIARVHRHYIFPGCRRVVLVVFTVASATTLGELLPRVFVVHNFRRDYHFFSFLRGPFRTFRVVLLGEVSHSFFSSGATCFFRFLVVPSVFFLRVSSHVVRFREGLRSLISLYRDPSTFWGVIFKSHIAFPSLGPSLYDV